MAGSRSCAGENSPSTISATEGAGALAGPLLRRVSLDLESYLPVSVAGLSTAVMNLVTAAVAERADHTDLLSAEVRERTLLLRLHAFIDDQLRDPDLDPGAVPAAHFISVRYLSRLFAEQNTTVAAWIRHRRPSTGRVWHGTSTGWQAGSTTPTGAGLQTEDAHARSGGDDHPGRNQIWLRNSSSTCRSGTWTGRRRSSPPSASSSTA